MNDSWLEIACDVPEEYADVVAEFLTELSGNGVCVDNRAVDAFSQSEIPASVRVTVKAYLSAADDPALPMAEVEGFLARLSSHNPDAVFAPPVLAAVNTEDWSSSWKVHFKPLRIGAHLLIVPTWEEIEAVAGDLVIRIDPGMAFGTGGHETTRLCLEMVETVMAEGGGGQNLRCLIWEPARGFWPWRPVCWVRDAYWHWISTRTRWRWHGKILN